jgi:hypothetical protein
MSAFPANWGNTKPSSDTESLVLEGFKWVNYDPVTEAVTPATNLGVPIIGNYNKVFYAQSDTVVAGGQYTSSFEQAINGLGTPTGITAINSKLLEITPARFTNPFPGADGVYPEGYSSGTFTLQALSSNGLPLGKQLALFLSEMDNFNKVESAIAYSDSRGYAECYFNESVEAVPGGNLNCAFELMLLAYADNASIEIGHVLRSDLAPSSTSYTEVSPISASFNNTFLAGAGVASIELWDDETLAQTVLMVPGVVDNAGALVVANWLMTGSSLQVAILKRPISSVGLIFRLNIVTNTKYVGDFSTSLLPPPYIDGDWRVDFIVRNYNETKELNRMTKMASLATLTGLVYQGPTTFTTQPFNGNFRADCAFTLQNIHPTITLTGVAVSLAFIQTLAHSGITLVPSSGSSFVPGPAEDTFILKILPQGSVVFSYTTDLTAAQLNTNSSSVSVVSEYTNKSVRLLGVDGQVTYSHSFS